MEDVIMQMCNSATELIELINKLIQMKGYQNEQWVLDYQDKLNELSVQF